MSARFSKLAMIDSLYHRARDLQKAHGFDPGNGWDQVKDAAIGTVVDYGRYRMLLDLAEDLEAAVSGCG